MTPYLTHRIFRINSTLSKVSRQQLGILYVNTFRKILSDLLWLSVK